MTNRRTANAIRRPGGLPRASAVGLCLWLGLGCTAPAPSAPGESCWDLDEDGRKGEQEDRNGDGAVDVLDCQTTSAGQACWDLDGDGQPSAGEDTNGDGAVDVYDCRATETPGDTGSAPGGEAFLGDLTLASVEAAEAFCESYVGVNGSLELVFGLGFDDASALGCLESVRGDLTITLRGAYLVEYALDGERSWEGLELANLRVVTGSVYYDNPHQQPRLAFPVLATAGALYFEFRECYPEAGLCESEVSLPLLEQVAESAYFLETGRIHMPALQRVGWILEIIATGMTDLSTLPNLQSLGTLSVQRSELLTSVGALGSIQRVDGRLTISHNTRLPTSEAEALVEAIGRENIGGEITITGNAE